MGERRSRSVAGALRGFLHLRKAGLMRWRPYAVVIVALLLLGGGYDLAMSRIRPMMTEQIELVDEMGRPVPLSTFPMRIDPWEGERQALTPDVEQVAGNDDYVIRVYTNDFTHEVARLYIAYAGRPRNMHDLEVCLRSGGYIIDDKRFGQLRLDDGPDVPCIIYRCHKLVDGQPTEPLHIINYYVLNGEPTNDRSDFGGLGWRLPNLAGDPAWYVAKIQVSGNSEAAVLKLATITAPHVLQHLPDQEGKVAAEGLSPAEAQSQESR